MTNDLELQVDREYSNIHDVDACVVWVPDNVPENMKNLVSDVKRGLKLSDIAGLPCGHVPRGLASAFRYIIDAGGVITATVTGEPLPSFPPWPPMLEKGGGVVIPCQYKVRPKNINAAITIIEQHIENMLEMSVVEVSLS